MILDSAKMIISTNHHTTQDDMNAVALGDQGLVEVQVVVRQDEVNLSPLGRAAKVPNH